MNLRDIKRCLAGLYGVESMADFICSETAESLCLYVNDVIPVLRQGRATGVSINVVSVITSIADKSPVCDTFESECELIPIMMRMYPARLTIDQFIVKTKQEVEQLNYSGMKRAVYEDLNTWSKSDLKYLLTIADEAVACIKSKTPGNSSQVNRSVSQQLKLIFQKINNEYGDDIIHQMIEYTHKRSQNPYFFSSQLFTYLLHDIAAGLTRTAYADGDVRWIMDSEQPDEYFDVCCIFHDMVKIGRIS